MKTEKHWDDYKEDMRSVSQWRPVTPVNEAQDSSELLLIMQIQLTAKYHVTASTARPPKLWLSHPVPDSNIITWLNLKGKLSFDLPRREKKICCEAQGLGWRHPDVSAWGCHGDKGISCYWPFSGWSTAYTAIWRGLHLHRWSLKNVLARYAKKQFDTWTVPLSRIMMLLGEKHTWINFPLPLQSVHQSGVMALALLFFFFF